MSDPVGFSSPMGGRVGKRASEAAIADLTKLVQLSDKYAGNMERGAKSASRLKAAGGAGGHYLDTVLGNRATSSGAANGGGARIPSAGKPPRGFAPMEDDAPTGAYQAAARRNAGAPRMPQWPGATGATAASIPGLGGADYPEQPTGAGGARGRALGGGMMRSFGGGALKAAAALGGGMVANVDNARSADWLANRTALATNGGYNKQAAAERLERDFRNSFLNNEQRGAAVGGLLSRGGFAAGSSGWNTQTQNIRAITALNPTLGGAAAASMVTQGQRPSVFNMARMTLGVNTIGAGGAQRSTSEIAQEVYRSMGGKGTPGADYAAAAFGEGGSMRFQLGSVLGMDDNAIQGYQDYFRASGDAGKFLTDKEMAARKGPSSNTMLGTDQERASGDMAVITAQLKEFAGGYMATQKALTSATKELADVIRGMPSELRTAIFGTGGGLGALTRGGGGIGNAAGAALTGGLGGATALLAKGGLRGLRGPVGAGARAAIGAPGIAGAAGSGLLGLSLGTGALVAGGVAAAGFGLKGVMGADTSKGRFSRQAWGSAWEAGLGGMFGYKYDTDADKRKAEIGDGPGAMPMSMWSSMSGAMFNGREMGDGPGDLSTQSAKQRERGGETVGVLEELLSGMGGGYRVVSRKRSGQSGVTATGRTSYHATGHALDIAGPTPVPKGSRTGSPALLAINRYLAQFGEGLNELIYSGPGGINISDGRPHSYKDPTYSNHFDHVHVAATPGMLKNLEKKKGGGGFMGLLKRIAGGIYEGSKRFLGLGDDDKKAGSSPIGSRRAPGRGVSRSRQGGRGSRGFSQAGLIEDLLGDLSSGGPISRPHVDDPSEANAEDRPRTSAAGAVGADAIDKFLYGLRMHESQGDYAAENGGTRGAVGRDSSASGAYQYLDSTWNKYQGYPYAAAAPPAVQDARARSDQMSQYAKYKNWRLVAAAHFRGSGWAANHANGKGWDDPVPGNPGLTTNKYVDKVLRQSGLPETGDGPGAPAVPGAMGQTADVPTPRAHAGASSGRGSVTVHSRGGSPISIGKVEVHLSTPQVSQTEARRIGKMVMDEIAREARMREMSR